jgi:hypothetical protein
MKVLQAESGGPTRPVRTQGVWIAGWNRPDQKVSPRTASIVKPFNLKPLNE